MGFILDFEMQNRKISIQGCPIRKTVVDLRCKAPKILRNDSLPDKRFSFNRKNVVFRQNNQTPKTNNIAVDKQPDKQQV